MKQNESMGKLILMSGIISWYCSLGENQENFPEEQMILYCPDTND